MQRKKYDTERLMLRPLTLRDFKTWRDFYVFEKKSRNKYANEPRNAKSITLKVFKEVITRHKKRAKDDRVYIYPAFLKEIGEMVGAVDLSVFIRGPYQMGNLGYQVHERFHRMGFGLEMLKCVRAKIQIDVKLKRIEAAINLDNIASRKLAKSAGLHYEGIKKEYIFEGGEWVDHHIYVSILK